MTTTKKTNPYDHYSGSHNSLHASLTIPTASPADARSDSPTVTSFEFAQGMALRSVIHDGEPWFIAADACKALGYVDAPAALAQHVDADERFSTVIHLGTRGNPRRTIISESGLYALILRSNKATALPFQKWVTRTVLPALRAGGVYVLDQEKADLTAMSHNQLQAWVKEAQDKAAEAVAAAATIRWAKSREDKNDYRAAMKWLRR